MQDDFLDEFPADSLLPNQDNMSSSTQSTASDQLISDTNGFHLSVDTFLAADWLLSFDSVDSLLQ